jgi:serine/threonine-protein kinase RsbW
VTSTLTLKIASRLDHVHLLGLAVHRICAGIPLSEVEAYQAEVSVVEAVTNCIEHAYGGEPGHTVEVVMTVEPACIVFEIRDTGLPMPATTPHLPNQRPDDVSSLVEDGRGLFIMHAFMDEVTYTRAGATNVLRLVKVIRPELPT